jgi:L-seryl-tRNA(Ser) seleniumtransferase
MSNIQKALQSLPAVDKLLLHKEVKELITIHGKETVIFTIRQAIDFFRLLIQSGNDAPSESMVIMKIQEIIKLLTGRSLKKVINATGITIHTNLGRAPFGEIMLHEAFNLLEGYNNLEFDLQTGQRGNRNDHAVDLLKFLTGAEDVVIVNNCAAAVMFCLRTFAKNKEVIVSRGELVEIGGSFRIPDIMAASDCKMIEVGTTNKTRISDYKNAMTNKTALLFKAHKSNYVIQGFTEEVELEQLVELGKELNIPVMYDQGSGLLRSVNHPAFQNEPNIRAAVESGIDLICFSGDKLLGGPQAGIIVGKKKYIDKLKKAPMMRALRLCKTSLALLETACSYYLKDETLFEKNMIFKATAKQIHEIKNDALLIAELLQNAEISCEVIENTTQIGGGSLPGNDVKSFAIQVNSPGKSKKEKSEYSEKMYHSLLRCQVPVVGILRKGSILFDVLCIDKTEVDCFVQNIATTHTSILMNLQTTTEE